MIYNELKTIEDEKADLLARLQGAKQAMKKNKKPKLSTNLKPVTKTKFMLSNNKHLQNNSVRRSGVSKSRPKKREAVKKRGRGYHTINNFNSSLSPETMKGSMIFTSSIDKNSSRFKMTSYGTSGSDFLEIQKLNLQKNFY